MLKINVEHLLKEKGKTKYWLWKQTDLTYTNFDNLIKNRTKSIRYTNLEKLCKALECTPNDIFIEVEDDDKATKSHKKTRKKSKKK